MVFNLSWNNLVFSRKLSWPLISFVVSSDENMRFLSSGGLENWETGATDFDISGSIICLELFLQCPRLFEFASGSSFATSVKSRKCDSSSLEIEDKALSYSYIVLEDEELPLEFKVSIVVICKWLFTLLGTIDFETLKHTAF